MPVARTACAEAARAHAVAVAAADREEGGTEVEGVALHVMRRRAVRRGAAGRGDQPERVARTRRRRAAGHPVPRHVPDLAGSGRCRVPALHDRPGVHPHERHRQLRRRAAREAVRERHAAGLVQSEQRP